MNLNEFRMDLSRITSVHASDGESISISTMLELMQKIVRDECQDAVNRVLEINAHTQALEVQLTERENELKREREKLDADMKFYRELKTAVDGVIDKEL